jgi:hypothetical protein
LETVGGAALNARNRPFAVFSVSELKDQALFSLRD